MVEVDWLASVLPWPNPLPFLFVGVACKICDVLISIKYGESVWMHCCRLWGSLQYARDLWVYRGVNVVMHWGLRASWRWVLETPPPPVVLRSVFRWWCPWVLQTLPVKRPSEAWKLFVICMLFLAYMHN